MADVEITLADLAAEEDELRFATFSNDDAWALGTALVAAAREQQLPVAIDITRNGHQLFHAALADHRLVVAVVRQHLAQPSAE